MFQMNQICQKCENLSEIKFILLEQDRIKLICNGHRNQLVQQHNLESIFKEGNLIHILPDFQKKISDVYLELKASLSQFIKDTQLIKIRLQERLTKFDDLRKDIFDLNQLYKMESTRSWEMEQQISRVLTQFQTCFYLNREKAFRLMSKIEPFDHSIHFKLKNLLYDSL